MDDALESVLRLVAEGKLTAAEAAPILAALDDGDGSRGNASRGASPPNRTTTDAPGIGDAATVLRIEVREDGRQVVNLRFPLALGRAALDRLPGLGPSSIERIREALRTGVRGSILEIDDDGDGVRIVVE